MGDTTITNLLERLAAMDFAHRLAATRKLRGMTQQALADAVGVHVTQLRRYEAGTNQPTLDVLRALAVALTVTTDQLVFNDDERGPQDATLRLHLEALDQLDDDEKATVVALVESVLIPGPGRTTLCISSQVGCARACAFCETGRLGLERQLAAGEIIDQVRLARAIFHEAGGAPPLSNLVFMGMGEPFDNLPEVLRALRLLTDDRAFGFAPSRVTVSTVGVADKLLAFFAGTRAELAVSLNAPDDERRRT